MRCGHLSPTNWQSDWYGDYAAFRTMPNVICAMVAQASGISRNAIFLFGCIRHNPASFTVSYGSQATELGVASLLDRYGVRV